MPSLRPTLAPLLSLALLAVPASARAQSASDKAAAQALFDGAQKLGAQGSWAASCPKYEESNRLDPGIGVKLYLADCYDHLGRSASAWAMYEEAEEYARKASDPRQQVAHQRATRLEPRLVKFAVVVGADAKVDGMAIRRDGEEVGPGQWGVEVPVDPGQHVLSVTAPGKKDWTTSFEARDAAGTVRVEVPKLEDAPAPPTPVIVPANSPAIADQPLPPERLSEDPKKGDAQRLIGLLVGGGGILGLGIGSAFGLLAKSKLDDSNSDGHCHDGNQCDAVGVGLRSDAFGAATVSTTAFIVGGVGVAAGGVLWLTAPRARTSVGFVPVVTDHVAALMLDGRF